MFSFFFVHCIFPSQSYRVRETAETLVTAQPIIFGVEHENGSTLSTTEKIAIELKPFRPSKQIFDHLADEVYPDQINTKRVDVSRAFDNSATDQEPHHIHHKSLAPSFGNLLILPPESITYKFEENQEYDGNSKAAEYGEEDNDDFDINADGAPKGEDTEDLNSEISAHRSISKSKPKEVHYHKHKHFHEHDSQQENNRKPSQNQLRSNARGLRAENHYRSRSQTVKSKMHQNQHHRQGSRDEDYHKHEDKRNYQHHHHNKRHQHQNHRDHFRLHGQPQHYNNPQNGDQVHHNDYSSQSEDPSDSYTEHTESHRGEHHRSRPSGSYKTRKGDSHGFFDQDHHQEHAESHGYRNKHRGRKH